MCGTRSESRQFGEEKNLLLLSGLEERTTPQSLGLQLLSTDTSRLKNNSYASKGPAEVEFRASRK
jgi:hypothetical protein